MRLIIQPNADQLAKWAANYVVSKIKKANPTPEKPFKLALPTGSSPIAMYKELIKMNKAGLVSFENVITFNLDEYIGLDADHPQSYHTFMWKTLFNHIDIKKENVNIPNGVAEDIEAECEEYEQKIKDAGGIDLFLGGVGTDGHIAFNEPGSSLSSRTRIKTLTTKTIVDNSRFFDSVDLVPKTAITVGVGTLMESEEILLLVNGSHKARALYHAVEGAVNQMWTVSTLQLHRKGIIVCDYDACSDLKVSTYKYFLDIEHDNLDPDSLLK
ncbi:MAG TPA: glucosamine-6-phosphate deaminase [Dysgonamonadaceae bacterium]|nr:glucosamine-6-phosphate deaminase [Dysgonamonadaceae bacterium]